MSGSDVREVSDFIMKQLGIEPLQPTDQRSVVLFSRESNRKILNEQVLVKELEAKYSLPVTILSMERYNFREQVSILSRASLAIGLHGSMLIMSMFLPPVLFALALDLLFFLVDM